MLHPLAFTCILTIVAMVASYCVGGAYGRAGMAASLILGFASVVAFRMQSTKRTYESDSAGVSKKPIPKRHETSYVVVVPLAVEACAPHESLSAPRFSLSLPEITAVYHCAAQNCFCR